MGDGSSRLQGHVVSAAAVFAASLAFAPHAYAAPGVDEQVAAVQAASAPVVAEVIAVSEPAVAAAQPAVAQPVAAARPVVNKVAAAVKPHAAVVRAVLRSLPAVQHVVPAHRFAPAVHAATEAVARPTAVRPQHHTSTRVPSRARPFDRAAGSSLPPDARQLVVRSEPAAPAAIALAPAKTVTAEHAAPQLTLTPLCQAQLPGTVSPGVAGGGGAAAMPSHAAHGPPLAVVRLVTPLQAPRSHAHLLRIERPD
jgi:hypothetical protein